MSIACGPMTVNKFKKSYDKSFKQQNIFRVGIQKSSILCHFQSFRFSVHPDLTPANKFKNTIENNSSQKRDMFNGSHARHLVRQFPRNYFHSWNAIHSDLSVKINTLYKTQLIDFSFFPFIFLWIHIHHVFAVCALYSENNSATGCQPLRILFSF